ncbi:MAG: imidazolonepropionase [Phycisphaerales bacterium JB059]
MTPPPTRTLIRNARLLTMGPTPGPRRGADLGRLHALDRASLLLHGGVIEAIGDDLSPPPDAVLIEARGRVVMPAFVDAHTHACWAGDRLDEWERKQQGATYLELLQAGGGIMSTVRSVRAASEEQLARDLSERLGVMLAEGAAHVEVKSGYGLTTRDELKMLRAISRSAQTFPGTLHLTACIGHAKDPDQPGFVETTLHETLDAVHAEFPEAVIDAYCEQGAWSLNECLRLFDRALELGHRVRVHADQFNDLGMIPEAIRRSFLSVDHLEATVPESLRALGESETFGVMLPCSGFHVDGRYADGRGFLDAGGKLVLATNANPGSAPCLSMPMAIALAVRHLGLTAAQAIGAATANGAALLGLEDRGHLAPGRPADLVLLRHTDERQLGYEFGGRHIDCVIVGGRVVSGSP